MEFEEGLKEKFNRYNKLKPKLHKRNWCYMCDADIVSVGSKCKNCGAYMYPRRLKK